MIPYRRNFPKLFKIILFFLLLLTLLICSILQIVPTKFYVTKELYYLFHPELSILCYRHGGQTLPKISDTKIRKGKSIFFHETSCRSHTNGKLFVSSRQACAVESAAKMNPNFDVYLLFASPGVIRYEGTRSDKFIEALTSYPNVKLLHVNFENYIKGTMIEHLYDDGDIEFSLYPQSHASDILRYLTLWKYGGIYLDLDVVVIKSLEELPPNYSGAESANNVAAGVMNFEPTGLGHTFSTKCLRDLAKNFSGTDWGNNGPGVITRLLQHLCGVKKAKDMQNNDCKGFTIYPPWIFYPVPWWNWTMYFDPKQLNRVLNITKDAYAIHVWNKHSSKTQLNISDEAPYTFFAKKHCPKVLSTCDKYF